MSNDFRAMSIPWSVRFIASFGGRGIQPTELLVRTTPRVQHAASLLAGTLDVTQLKHLRDGDIPGISDPLEGRELWVDTLEFAKFFGRHSAAHHTRRLSERERMTAEGYVSCWARLGSDRAGDPPRLDVARWLDCFGRDKPIVMVLPACRLPIAFDQLDATGLGSIGPIRYIDGMCDGLRSNDSLMENALDPEVSTKPSRHAWEQEARFYFYAGRGWTGIDLGTTPPVYGQVVFNSHRALAQVLVSDARDYERLAVAAAASGLSDRIALVERRDLSTALEKLDYDMFAQADYWGKYF